MCVGLAKDQGKWEYLLIFSFFVDKVSTQAHTNLAIEKDIATDIPSEGLGNTIDDWYGNTSLEPSPQVSRNIRQYNDYVDEI